MSVCRCLETRFSVDCRLLVKESIANIGIPLDISVFLTCQCVFWRFDFFLGFCVLQTSLLCIEGEVSGVGSVAVAIGVTVELHYTTCEMWHVTGDTWHRTCVCFSLFWWHCYYPQTYRDSGSPVCRIFLYQVNKITTVLIDCVLCQKGLEL